MLTIQLQCSCTGSKNEERQRREDLVKGGWKEDREPFILVCCNKHCCKRELRFFCATFLHCSMDDTTVYSHKWKEIYWFSWSWSFIPMWQQDLLFIKKILEIVSVIPQVYWLGLVVLSISLLAYLLVYK